MFEIISVVTHIYNKHFIKCKQLKHTHFGWWRQFFVIYVSTVGFNIALSTFGIVIFRIKFAQLYNALRGRRDHDRMVVRFTTTCANQRISPLMLMVWLPLRERSTTLCDKVCHWPATGRCFSQVVRFPPKIKMTATI